MENWEGRWEVEFPASSLDELMLALIVRDLVHGTSFDVEACEDGTELALDFVAGDEVEEDVYRLLLFVEVEGPETREMVQAFTEQMLEELISEAEELMKMRQHLGSKPLNEIEFKTVPEDEERWDMIVPDWLAPDGAEVPFGFRSFLTADGIPWPVNSELDAHGRVVLIPFRDEAHLFGIPAPDDPEEETAESELPIHPDSS